MTTQPSPSSRPGPRTPRSWRRTTAAVAAVLVVGVAVVLVGGQRSAESGGAPPMRVDDDRAAERLDELAATAPVPQREVIAAGDVSGGEYRGAMDEALECMERDFAARGLDVDIRGPVASDDGFLLSYTYRLPATQSAAEATEVERACRAAHVNDVEAAFQLGRLVDDDYVEAVAARFSACLDDAGVPGGADDPRDAMIDAAQRTAGTRAHQRVADCAGSFPSVTNDPFGSGAAR